MIHRKPPTLDLTSGQRAYYSSRKPQLLSFLPVAPCEQQALGPPPLNPPPLLILSWWGLPRSRCRTPSSSSSSGLLASDLPAWRGQASWWGQGLWGTGGETYLRNLL